MGTIVFNSLLENLKIFVSSSNWQLFSELRLFACIALTKKFKDDLFSLTMPLLLGTEVYMGYQVYLGR